MILITLNHSKDTFVIVANGEIRFFTDKGLYKSFAIPGYSFNYASKTGSRLLIIDIKNELSFYTPAGLLKKVQLPF